MGTKITILVGTMTGTAQLCAQEMELALDDSDTRVETLLMDQLDSAVFGRDGVFLICTSTYGQGDVPDNARALYEDLQKKRRNSELWNELSWGQLGRSPDILAPYILSALHLKDQFSAVKHPKCDFGENIENYYKYCMSRDLFLTHALGDPQVDRSTQPQNEQRFRATALGAK